MKCFDGKATNAAITCWRKEQDFDGRRSYFVIIVSLRAVVDRSRRRRRRSRRAGAPLAGLCPRTRRSPLLAHLIDDWLQLRNGRQPVWRHVRRRIQAEFAQNVVSYRRIAIVTFCLHKSYLAVYSTKLFGELLLNCSNLYTGVRHMHYFIPA